MGGRLIVQIEDVKRVMSVLLSHVAANEGTTVAIEHDHFWSIPAEQLYNVYASPDGLTIGQLAESMRNLEEIANGDSPPSAYALVWLADILRAIGQEIVR